MPKSAQWREAEIRQIARIIETREARAGLQACDYSGIPAFRRASSHRVSTSGCLCGKRYLTFLMRKSGSLARTSSVALLGASRLPASAFDAAATRAAMKLFG